MYVCMYVCIPKQFLRLLHFLKIRKIHGYTNTPTTTVIMQMQ